MRAPKFTPGPWAVWDGPAYVGGGRDLCIGAGEKWLANMDHRQSKCWDEIMAYGSIHDDDNCPICTIDSANITAEQEANAHLIAAAPDLYDMLASIENDDGCIPAWLWNRIQQTLAKARGETP